MYVYNEPKTTKNRLAKSNKRVNYCVKQLVLTISTRDGTPGDRFVNQRKVAGRRDHVTKQIRYYREIEEKRQIRYLMIIWLSPNKQEHAARFLTYLQTFKDITQETVVFRNV